MDNQFGGSLIESSAGKEVFYGHLLHDKLWQLRLVAMALMVSTCCKNEKQHWSAHLIETVLIQTANLTFS